MTGFQKLIKYGAIALAAVLVVSILSGIFSAVGVLGVLFEGKGVAQDVTDYAVSQNITALDISIGAADLTVETADRFYVKSNLKNIKVTEENGALCIREKDSFATSYNGAVLTVGIPEGFHFTSIRMETGAGVFEADFLSAEVVSLELGAGSVKIGQLYATQKAEIEGGAGELTVGGGSIRNLDLDMGVGQLKLTAALPGDSQLDMGVGEANLKLLGTQEEYRIEIEKGIGQVTVDGASVDGGVYGSGVNDVEISGGVGAIHIDFQ